LGFLRRGQTNKDVEEGSFQCSKAGLFTCMCCSNPKGGEENLQFQIIGNSFEKLNRRLDNIER
jgi:hypothetical protein